MFLHMISTGVMLLILRDPARWSYLTGHIVKTATFKELAPYDPDCHYIRAASMARKIYGGCKRNGSRPQHFCKSSGGIARQIFQQLENMKIVETGPIGSMF